MSGYGKEFEQGIKEALLKVPDISVDRLYDPSGGYAGIKNIADFQAYSFPYQFYLECKSTQTNTLPFSNISTNQLSGLFEKSKIYGTLAGVLLWWVNLHVTVFINIEEVKRLIDEENKSINIKNLPEIKHFIVSGKLKRIFYDYDGDKLIKDLKIEAAEKWNKEVIKND